MNQDGPIILSSIIAPEHVSIQHANTNNDHAAYMSFLFTDFKCTAVNPIWNRGEKEEMEVCKPTETPNNQTCKTTL